MNNGIEKQRKALGKGLSALLPGRATAATSSAASPIPSPGIPQAAAAVQAEDNPPSLTGLDLPIDSIEPNPMQPRTVFQTDKLEELAASIRANGVIQPLIVRRAGSSFQIVAGERRLRAAKLAGLGTVPAIVQEIADRQMLELALIENIQREDLNPIETARAYDRLAHELHLSHDDIAKRTGKDRSSITNTLRLLKLPDAVQALLAEHRISMGHARAILGLQSPDEQTRFAEKAAAQGLSVRQVEKLVQAASFRDPKSSDDAEPREDPNVRAAVENLERALGTKVRIILLSEQRGRIEIDYYSPQELDRLYSQLLNES